MPSLLITTWSWGTKYGPEYVERLRAAVARNLTWRHEFRVLEPEPEDMHLTAVPGCFARLRAFDVAWQRRQGMKPGDRIVCLDLDLIVTGRLDDMLARPEPFAILQGVNGHAGRFNGSVWWTMAGYRPDVWSDFSLEAAAKVPHAEFPDDQAWFEAKMPDAGALGAEEGVFAFQKRNWPRGDALPKGARIVAFPGWRDPSKFTQLEWVKEHWASGAIGRDELARGQA
jgi:hypothetical protein